MSCVNKSFFVKLIMIQDNVMNYMNCQLQDVPYCQAKKNSRQVLR